MQWSDSIMIYILVLVLHSWYVLDIFSLCHSPFDFSYAKKFLGMHSDYVNPLLRLDFEP